MRADAFSPWAFLKNIAMHIGTLFLMAQFLTQGCCTRMTVIVYGLVKITGKKKENKKKTWNARYIKGL